MNDVWVSKAWVKPFLKLGATRHILFPESARNVPFTAENFSYLDALGRETYAWVRTYHLPDGRRRRFDGYMVYSPSRGCMIEYFGTHQHLVSDLEMVADARGGICVRSRAQRFFEHFVGFKIPPLLTADGEIRCWFEEASNLFRIEMRVWHRRWGQLLGQSGTYTVVFHPIDKVPPYALPKRVEARE